MTSCSTWIYSYRFPTKYIGIFILVLIPTCLLLYIFRKVKTLTKKNNGGKAKGNDKKMVNTILLLFLSLLIKEIELLTKMYADLNPDFHNKWNTHIG